MDIRFTTNLDEYKKAKWPDNLEHVPRKGEFVQMTVPTSNHFLRLRLPVSLEVKRVVHTDTCVKCELWYSDLQVKAMKAGGVNMFNPE